MANLHLFATVVICEGYFIWWFMLLSEDLETVCPTFRVDSFCHRFPSSLSCAVEGGVHPPSSCLRCTLTIFCACQEALSRSMLAFCADALVSLLGWRISKNKLLEECSSI